jgi:hypothetical protein
MVAIMFNDTVPHLSNQELLSEERIICHSNHVRNQSRREIGINKFFIEFTNEVPLRYVCTNKWTG